MVVIVLLNVLIAIVSDSYEKCLTRSEFLFGRARIVLLAQLVSFQQLLRFRNDNSFSFRSWKKQSISFLLFSVVLIVSWITMEALHYDSSRQELFVYNMCSISVIVLSFMFIFFVLSRISSSAHEKNDNDKSSRIWCLGYCLSSNVEKMLLRFVRRGKNNAMEAWKGQVNFLRDEMDKTGARTMEHTKELIEQEASISNAQRKQLEVLIDRSETRIMEQMNKSNREIERNLMDKLLAIEKKLAVKKM